MNILETKGLTKFYGKRKAVESLDLSVPKGSIYGFLGCNGAGKTTTLCIISGLVKKTHGKVFVNGNDLDRDENKIKKSIGIMPQDNNLYSHKTAFQNILYCARLKGMEKEKAVPEISSLFNELGLEYLKGTKLRQLSHGQAKLLRIMQAFLNKPELVILDEPISGFDPKKIIMLREFIRKKSKETTILISSHNLDEVDRLCTHIGIIHEGKLILQGKKEKIKKGKSLERVFIENI